MVCNGLFFLTTFRLLGNNPLGFACLMLQKSSKNILPNGGEKWWFSSHGIPIRKQIINNNKSRTTLNFLVVWTEPPETSFFSTFSSFPTTFRFENLPYLNIFTIGTGGCSSGFCFQAVHTSLPMRANVAPWRLPLWAEKKKHRNRGCFLKHRLGTSSCVASRRGWAEGRRLFSTSASDKGRNFHLYKGMCFRLFWKEIGKNWKPPKLFTKKSFPQVPQVIAVFLQLKGSSLLWLNQARFPSKATPSWRCLPGLKGCFFWGTWLLPQLGGGGLLFWGFDRG